MHYLLQSNKSHPKLHAEDEPVLSHSPGEIQEPLCWVPLAQGLPEGYSQVVSSEGRAGAGRCFPGAPTRVCCWGLSPHHMDPCTGLLECSPNTAAGFPSLSDSGDSKEQAAGPFWTFAFSVISLI